MDVYWSDQAVINGIRAKAFFFDAEKAKNEANPVRRVLPFFQIANPVFLVTESDRMNFQTGRLVAQPDAVFKHGTGYISVEYKTYSGRQFRQESWHKIIRLKDMLQCILGGYAIAQHTQKTTACILRYDNCCFLLHPSPEVVDQMIRLIPDAMRYYDEPRNIASSLLAQFSVDRIKRVFGNEASMQNQAGQAAHEELLRR